MRANTLATAMAESAQAPFDTGFDNLEFRDGREFEVWFFNEPNRTVQTTFESCKGYGVVVATDIWERIKANQPRKLGEGASEILLRLRDEDLLMESTMMMYTSLYTIVDYKRGADGFLVVDGNIFTIDVTTKPEKSSVSADFLITREDILSKNIDDTVSSIAKKIARRLVL